MSPIDFEAFRAKLDGKHAESPARLETQQQSSAHAPTGTAVETRAANADGRSELATRLESVSGKAVNKLDEIMALPLDPEDRHFGGVLRAQVGAANTALNTQVRVDENALRRQSLDRLPALLALVNETAKRLPQTVEHVPSEKPVIDGGGDGS